MTSAPPPPPTPAATFYFDLASPVAYLAAERVLRTLPGTVEWQPVLERELGEESVGSFSRAEELDIVIAGLERRARELGLQALRWPQPFPFDSSLAMRAATYAKSIGRVVAFAQAAFRQAFAGGHSLEDPNFVLIAAAACEMHPAAVLRAVERGAVAEQLARATGEAARAGVGEVPAVRLARSGAPDAVYVGEHAPEEAAAQMRGETGAAR